jgi:hypothetical protein
VKEFLDKVADPHMAELYSHFMEVQVNTVDGTERVTGTTKKGKNWWGWKDPKTGETWKNFRIPWNANTVPEYKDSAIRFNLETKCECVGLTGWDWENQLSHWVGFDYDSIVGHEKSKGLTMKQLDAVKERLLELPFVKIIRSKSGRGFHAYVFFDEPVPCANHTEHAALARAVLSEMSGLVGHDLFEDVDKYGGVLWIWHREATPGGFQVVREASERMCAPQSWRNHIDVIRDGALKVRSRGGDDPAFEDLIARTKQTTLDDDHRRLIEWMRKSGWFATWDNDRHMLTAHTAALAAAHKELGFRGLFETVAGGTSKNDYNCFMFPLRNGSWVVRRFGAGSKEHPAWQVDQKGWTKCMYNVPTDIDTAARACGADEIESGEWVFEKALTICSIAMKYLDAPTIPLDVKYHEREGRLKPMKDRSKVLVRIKMQDKNEPRPDGWRPDKKSEYLQKVVDIERGEIELEPPDEDVRLMVAGGFGAGWFIHVKEDWHGHGKSDIKDLLRSEGRSGSEVDKLIGLCLKHPYYRVSVPFQPEYIGNRQWNLRAARLRYKPIEGQHPTWDSIFDHIGRTLTESVLEDSWCKANSVVTGAMYLKLWVASMFQYPAQPLPYLFLYSPDEDTGKSTMWEALHILFADENVGCVRADRALTTDFNGELEGAVLAVVEETNLQVAKQARNRMKDYVTGRTISIRNLYQAKFDTINYTHWIQCANDVLYCPVMKGDSRVVVILVEKPAVIVPKAEFFARLEAEAAAFMHTALNLHVPRSTSRLRIPTITSAAKQDAQTMNQNELEAFITDFMYPCNGHLVCRDTFVQAFKESIITDPQATSFWTSHKINNFLRKNGYDMGRKGGGGRLHILNHTSNIADTPRDVRWHAADERSTATEVPIA